MKNKVIKIIGTIIICITLINIVMMDNNTCMAISDVTQNPGGWKPTDDDEGGDILNQKMGPILNIIRNAGVIISVLTLSVIALKIMFSSVEGKAEYKQKLLPWAIGAFLVFSMTTIPSLIYDLVDTEQQAQVGTGATGGAGGHLGNPTRPEMDTLP